jgi:transposase-like protein
MCGSAENQIKQGRTAAGSQRCLRKNYGKKYTIDHRSNAYPEEERQAAIKMYYSGVSGRGVGKILGMSKSNALLIMRQMRHYIAPTVGQGIKMAARSAKRARIRRTPKRFLPILYILENISKIQ